MLAYTQMSSATSAATLPPRTWKPPDWWNVLWVNSMRSESSTSTLLTEMLVCCAVSRKSKPSTRRPAE